MNDPKFKPGDTLKSLKHVSRRDGKSSLVPGDIVKVTQVFAFDYDGKKCWDLTVQKDHDAPIAVIYEVDRFERVNKNNQ
jgi:hypothetical protein